MTHPDAVMGIDPTPSIGVSLPLEQRWPPLTDRYVNVRYPFQVNEVGVRAGDYGVWSVRPGFPPLFTTLGNVRHKLWTPLILKPAHANEKCSNNIYRYCFPFFCVIATRLNVVQAEVEKNTFSSR